ncbi:hypothetical protein VTL71DRAFT_5730 [Oculimacula yallundae]|uniref:2EXR domain-containing protein n=1 Tax=Oculimacula yallundae TaxID=86028 RepID=A0ABR4BYD7_9HELO
MADSSPSSTPPTCESLLVPSTSTPLASSLSYPKNLTTLPSQDTDDLNDELEVTRTAACNSLSRKQQTNELPTPPSASVHLETFTLFPKLPLELRWMIWQAEILDPEIIGVGCTWDILQHEMSGWKYRLTTCRFPSVRGSNREARAETQRFPEKLLITYPPNVQGDRIITMPACDIVLFHEDDSDSELGLWLMLEDLAEDCIPPPYMPRIALHYKWRALFFDDLESMEKKMQTLDLFGCKELIFVVGDERACPGLIVGLPPLTQQPEEILEVDDMKELRDYLEIEEGKAITWENLKLFEYLRFRDAMVISDWSEWPKIEISYRGVD